MAELVYAMCALLSVSCATQLLRSYLKGRSRFSLWGSLAFAMLAVNNLLLFIDLVILPDVDFSGGFFRALSGAIAGTLLLYGLIWEAS